MVTTRFVTFHYKMKNSQGELLESSYEREPMMFLEGRAQILPKLESVIRTLAVGQKQTIAIHQSDAYGNRNEKLVLRVPYAKLPKEDITIGKKFFLNTKSDGVQIYRVVALIPGGAVLDGNHWLAGIDLIFEVEITSAREATKSEISEDANATENSI